MKRSILARLDDMLDAIETMERILPLIEGAEPASKIEKLALERTFEILSEASRYIPDPLKAEHLQTDWRLIAGLGNILRHDYERVELAVLLGIAKDEVPALKTIVLELRAQLEAAEQ